MKEWWTLFTERPSTLMENLGEAIIGGVVRCSDHLKLCGSCMCPEHVVATCD